MYLKNCYFNKFLCFFQFINNFTNYFGAKIEDYRGGILLFRVIQPLYLRMVCTTA